MEQITVQITGVATMLQNNAQRADPSDEIAQKKKVITSQRKKTDKDYEAIKNLELLGSVYVNEKGKIVIPRSYIWNTLFNAAKMSRKGPLVKSGLFCNQDFELNYKGKEKIKKVEDILKHEEFCYGALETVNQGKVMKYRAKFEEWSVKVTVEYLPDIIDRKDIIEMFKVAGERCGLGDKRPQFGRFTIKEAA